MKKNILLLSVGAGLMLASCSSVLKNTVTSDDVYYSVGKDIPEATTVVKSNDRRETAADDEYVSYWDNADDNYLRMKVRDRDRWSNIDDLNYWYGYDARFGYNNPNYFSSLYNPFQSNFGINNSFRNYGFGGHSFFNNAHFNYNSWNNPFSYGYSNMYNNWNNPYGWNSPIIIINKFPTNSSLNNIVRSSSRTNLSGYSNNQFYRGSNSVFNQQTTTDVRNIRRTSDNNTGNGFRSIFRSNGNSSSDNGTYRPSRTFDNSNSSSNTNRTTTTSSSSSSSNSSSGSSSSGSSRSTGSGTSGSSRGGN